MSCVVRVLVWRYRLSVRLRGPWAANCAYLHIYGVGLVCVQIIIIVCVVVVALVVVVGLALIHI